MKNKNISHICDNATCSMAITLASTEAHIPTYYRSCESGKVSIFFQLLEQLLKHCAIMAFILATTALPIARAEAKKTKEAAPAEPPSAEKVVEEKKSYECRSQISYSWQPRPQVSPAPTPGIPSQIPQPPPPLPSVREVAFEDLVIHDEDETEAKIKGHDRIIAAKKRAYDDCLERHESETSCIRSKLKASNSQYTFTDFHTRKAILDATKKDCTSETGECITTKATELDCRVKITEVPAPPAPPAEKKPAATGGKKK